MKKPLCILFLFIFVNPIFSQEDFLKRDFGYLISENYEKDFYEFLIYKKLIDSSTRYNESKIYFLDSLHNYMNRIENYQIPDSCPYYDQKLYNTIQLSNCFIEEEIIGNVYFNFKYEDFSGSFGDFYDENTLSDISKQKKFNYFCCKFFRVYFYENQVYTDPLTEVSEVIRIKSSNLCVLTMFYD